MLVPLSAHFDLRKIVIQGMRVAPGVGAGTPGEVNGTNGYLAVVPVPCRKIAPAAVPEPASLSRMPGGFGTVGGAAWRGPDGDWRPGGDTTLPGRQPIAEIQALTAGAWRRR